MSGGYCACSCRDCFEIAIAANDEDEVTFCWECEEAGCELDHDCQKEDFDDDAGEPPADG